jgi:hypothetical protein
LSFVANDIIFFSDDVQTTTIAVAIASSLCCSIVWAVFHIISVVQPSKGTAKAKSAAFYIGKNPASRKNSYAIATYDNGRQNASVIPQMNLCKNNRLCLNIETCLKHT